MTSLVERITPRVRLGARAFGAGEGVVEHKDEEHHLHRKEVVQVPRLHEVDDGLDGSMMASMVSCGTARRGSPGTQVSTLIACMNDAQKSTPIRGSTTIWLCIQTRTPHTYCSMEP